MRRFNRRQDGLGFDRSEGFVYHQGQIVLRLADAGAGPLDESSLTNRYLWGPTVDHLLVDEVVSSLAAEGARSWALGDHLGTIRDWADDAGAIENHLEYDSYRNLLAASNSSAPDHLFGFTGRPYDADSELQNNWNRWYDAKVGRWVSEDPIGFAGADGNLSRYVRNAPLSYHDPMGLFTISFGVGCSGVLGIPSGQASIDLNFGISWSNGLEVSIGPTLGGGPGLGAAGGLNLAATVTNADSIADLNGQGGNALGFAAQVPVTGELVSGPAYNGVQISAGPGAGAGVYYHNTASYHYGLSWGKGIITPPPGDCPPASRRGGDGRQYLNRGP